jgi:hypothetical protein
MGTEQGMGCRICSRLSAHHDVIVLTQFMEREAMAGDERHREEAEQAAHIVMRAVAKRP